MKAYRRFVLMIIEWGNAKLVKPLLLAAAIVFPPCAALADLMSVDMQQLQEDVQLDRSLAVSNNMQLSPADKKTFWPVYENYLSSLEQINRSYNSIIQSYVYALNNNSLDDDTAKQLTGQFLAAQSSEIDLRKTYVANLAKVLPPKTVARALQLENKIRAIAWYGLASQIPLVMQ